MMAEAVKPACRRVGAVIFFGSFWNLKRERGQPTLTDPFVALAFEILVDAPDRIRGESTDERELIPTGNNSSARDQRSGLGQLAASRVVSGLERLKRESRDQ